MQSNLDPAAIGALTEYERPSLGETGPRAAARLHLESALLNFAGEVSQSGGGGGGRGGGDGGGGLNIRLVRTERPSTVGCPLTATIAGAGRTVIEPARRRDSV